VIVVWRAVNGSLEIDINNDAVYVWSQMAKRYDAWFADRAYMWPTFAGNGYLAGVSLNTK
jgi:hypothetical protein